MENLGSEQAHQNLRDEWTRNWEETSEVLRRGMDWPIQSMASAYAEKETHWLEGLFRKKTEEPKKSVDTVLWDEWAQSRFDDELDELVLTANRQQLAITPIRRSLQSIRTSAKKKIEMQAELSVREALVRPGNGVQRFFMKFFGFCATVFPLATMGWVGYQVFYEYYE